MAASDWGNRSGRQLFSEDDWRTGSEYGGVGGLIAPIDSPHTESITAPEQMMVIYNIDPLDTVEQPIEVTKQMAK